MLIWSLDNGSRKANSVFTNSLHVPSFIGIILSDIDSNKNDSNNDSLNQMVCNVC